MTPATEVSQEFLFEQTVGERPTMKCAMRRAESWREKAAKAAAGWRGGTLSVSVLVAERGYETCSSGELVERFALEGGCTSGRRVDAVAACPRH